MHDPLADIETRVAGLGLPMSRVLDGARVDWCQWSRWKKGATSPTQRVLLRIYTELVRLEGEQQAKP